MPHISTVTRASISTTELRPGSTLDGETRDKRLLSEYLGQARTASSPSSG